MLKTERLGASISSIDLETFNVLHEQAHKETEVRRVAIVASKGTLDMAYPALILANTAAAMGMEAGVFFTFYGLDIINKKKFKHLQVAPLGNPAAPIPVPNLFGAIPGATFLATSMMRFLMGKQKMPSIEESLATAKEFGVKLYACSTTMGVMGVKEKDLIEGCDISGAAGFLEYASKAQVTLFI